MSPLLAPRAPRAQPARPRSLFTCFTTLSLVTAFLLPPAAAGANTAAASTAAAQAAEAPAPLAVAALTTNGRANPLGIPAESPSFSWSLTAPASARGVTQRAYRIRVGTAPGLADLWDSGRVESSRQIDIVPPGSLGLASATRYHWQVRVWDQADQASEWSAPAWFETGLLTAADWSGATWIARPVQAPDLALWTDYTATVEFTLENEAFGVFLRSSADGQNAFLLQLNLTGATPVLRPHRRSNGAYAVLANVDLAPLGFTRAGLLGTRHTLRFELAGTTLRTHLDGTLIDTRSGIDLPAGLVGFRTFGAEAARLHAVSVVATAGSVTLAAPDFANGENGFAGGSLIDGALRVSGTTDALFANLPSSLPLLRGEFTAREGLVSARLHASAQGLYVASINGQKAGDHHLAPGWTDYDQRIQHQTLDVTALVRPGANVLGAALGDGWFRGKVGLNWTRVYGTELAFIAKLKLDYADGTTEWFATDLAHWRAGDGPFVRGDLQDGEDHDARLARAGWDSPGFDASGWRAVAAAPDLTARLTPQPDEPVRELLTLPALTRTEILPGTWIYDFGQNMVGVARVVLTGARGRTVTLRHAEDLHRTGPRAGQIYTDNLRSARATDTYTFAADGTVTYQPTFTQHGFRYLQITGVATPPALGDVHGVVLGSDLPDTGDLHTGHPMLDKLVSNIRWGQRGNFLSIPTDTPARDERLGWTGDISVFAPAAARYQDTRAFLSKWMTDVRDAQKPDGNIPAIVPQPRNEFDQTGVGWADAFITVPHSVWRATGDARILRENWEAMKRFYAFVHTSATHDGDLLEQGRSSWFSGDWLTLENVNRLEEHKVIATAYFAENTRLMAEMAAALGETELAAQWTALVPQIRAAFVSAYRAADGTIHTGTQTAYAHALALDLIADPAQRAQTGQKFVQKLAADGYHLRTGFLGTPWLLPALAKIGREDLAMRVLLNEDYPSWGFPISIGATTMWERWNSVQPNLEFGPVDMNSFNHYAYGAVGDWMFEKLGGLLSLESGYKTALVAPLVGAGGLAHVRCTQRTPRGTLASEWDLAPGAATLTVEIPVNTTAIVRLPACDGTGVLEGAQAADAAPGVSFLRLEDGAALYSVGSGTYAFSWAPTLAAPADLRAEPGAGLVRLAWSAALGATGYDVKRAPAAGGDFVTIAAGVTATDHLDTGVIDGVAYRYLVTARDAAGAGLDSAAVTVTPAALQNPGFESPATATFLYAPPDAGWSFSAQSGNNGAGLSANNSLFTAGSAAAPEGAQLAFLQGTGSLAQTVSGLTPGVTYHLLFAAAQRATGASWNQKGQTWRLTLDGATLADYAPGQAATAFVTHAASFTAAAQSHRIAFVGTNTRGGDNTVFIDQVRLLRDASVALANAGFETPATATFAYAPAGAAWSFSAQSGNAGAGLARNASLFTSANPAAPEGVQVAFLQGAASFGQTLTGLVPGMPYQLLFASAQRAGYVNGGQTWSVRLDGAPLASFRPGAEPVGYTGYAVGFTATATSHALSIVGTNANGGDNTAFFDRLRLVAAAPLAPASVAGVAEHRSASLSWSGVEGATAYLVTRGTGAGGAETVFKVPANLTSFADTGLVNGTTYFYGITAVNEAGVGPFVAELSVTPLAPPVGERERAAPMIELGIDGEGRRFVVVTVTETVPGHFYSLEFSDDLATSAWSPVPDLETRREGTGAPLAFVAPLGETPRRFFRVLIES